MVKTEIKPGYKTTEFWLTFIVMTVGTMLASGVIGEESDISQVLGVIMDVMAALGYTFCRSAAKKSTQ